MLSDRFCPVPFTNFRVSTNGDVSLCSPNRMKVPVVGNVLRDSPADVWNSAEAQTLRQTILDGSFSQCVEAYCPALQKRSLPTRRGIKDEMLRRIIDQKLVVLDTRPTMVNMHLDKSCNLKCPTCRSEITVIQGKDRDRAMAVKDRLLESGTLSNAREMILCGYGEVFASPVYLQLLRSIDPADYPKLSIKILSNGLLLTDRMWQSFRNAHSLIKEISISVDAASSETYAINRGGNFQRLLDNLQMVSRLRSDGRIARFSLNFVVQTNNFAEMPDFVRFAKALGCDRVYFQRLADAGKAGMADFAERAIHAPKHPRHQDLLSVLSRAELRDPIVELYTIGGLVPPRSPDSVGSPPSSLGLIRPSAPRSSLEP
jgi:MoaA/NifB/PqqE/SkfB family radical SAM enzyme